MGGPRGRQRLAARPRWRSWRACSPPPSARSSSGAWASPSTERGEDNVRAIVNLALARGFVGREGCGLMPIRGHSGVQGGAEMGCYATALPGGAGIDSDDAGRLAALWGFEVAAGPGDDRAGDDRRGGTRRARRARSPPAATSSTCCPDPAEVERGARGDSRCGSTWTSSPPSRCSSTRRRRCCCSRRRRATRRRAGSPRRRPSGGSSSAPRSRGRGSARRGRSGR